MKTSGNLKKITTFGIIICTFLHGLCYYSFNITLIDFKEIINKPLNDVSVGQTVRNLAACVGSILVGSVFSNYGNTQIILSLFVAFEGIMAAILTIVPNLILYDIINAFIGLSCGLIETISFVNIVNLWDEKSDPFIQALGFAVNFAMVVSPLLFSPFLSNVESEEHDLVCGESHVNKTANVTQEVAPFGKLHKSQIWMPHFFIGVMMAIIGSCCVILECRRIKYEEKNNVDDHNHETISLKVDHEATKIQEEQNTPYSKPCRLLFIILCCLLCAIFWNLHISKSKAVMMMTAISSSMAIGCLAGLLASMRIRPMAMLAILTFFLVIGNSILFFAASELELLAWIGGVTCSFVFGNYFVSVYNLLQEKAGMSNRIGSLFTVSAYILTAIGLPVLLANFIECTPIVFLYYTSSSITASIILYIIIAIICWGRKFKRVSNDIKPNATRNKLSIDHNFNKLFVFIDLLYY
ncbi:sodium-dependent glucose transporter 1-like protein [Leptotrombidium deliense]|uniref:Sodium-dependent glucose transporter 1-like protein n=1 Tax=Leptotrombidium deliense TaxID=299467 RepID=A0A443SBJ3_9ACAR|nr:sodium-dependent glucose transporter 1-like protein [Leptotrombidium deliense]